jgi:hypothetical protein
MLHALSFPAICSPDPHNPYTWTRPHLARSSRRRVPMDPSSAPSERPRKRRAINACVNCRTSKVRCDGKRPCQRCERNDATCQYHDAFRHEDEGTLRIDRLEAAVAALRHEMAQFESCQTAAPLQGIASMSSGRSGERTAASNAVNVGLITWEQATLWFRRYITPTR